MFSKHHGLYRFFRMPFGMKNAPGMFQRVIEVILATVKCKYALIYWGDVIIFLKTSGEFLTHVASVLRLLSKAGVKLKLKKCHFFTETIDYFGHVITQGKLDLASHAPDANHGIIEPTKVT